MKRTKRFGTASLGYSTVYHICVQLLHFCKHFVGFVGYFLVFFSAVLCCQCGKDCNDKVDNDDEVELASVCLLPLPFGHLGRFAGAHSNAAAPPPRLGPSVSVTFMKQTHLTLLRAFQFVAASSVAAPTVATSSAADVAIVIAVAIVFVIVAVAIVKP